MKKSLMKKKGCLAAAAALILCTGPAVGQAMAYFTAFAEAEGSVQIHMGFADTTLEDDVQNWVKHVAVTNNGEYPCYVRVRAFAGEGYREMLEYRSGAGRWTDGQDGYWYYDGVFAPGARTEDEFLVKLKKDQLATSTGEDGEAIFNVIVVQECTAVLYDEEGNPYADWNILADSGRNQEGE